MKYNKNTFKSRIFEALFVKQYYFSFNVQDNSAQLELFD